MTLPELSTFQLPHFGASDIRLGCKIFQSRWRTKKFYNIWLQKSLSEMAELELKHSRAHAQMLKATIANLRADLWKKTEKTFKPEAFFKQNYGANLSRE